MNRDAEIFAEAIELPEAERAAFLDRACGGDAALKQRVLLLLTGYSAAGVFLQNSPLERPATPTGETIGSRIGRYTLVRQLGEGGCGIVYLAEQHEPVRRQVALKVIKLGMDTRNVIARFEAERQALALMDHPDIARVFDAGATDSGRPYFVMEFVDGVPITKYCDEHSLSMAERLQLFARVCLALQHAHQKGIIHRDLKPSNILVAQTPDGPAPKVIDFGIAKATQGRLTEHTLVTGFDQFIGTPAYMSPEQAELRELDIDTRSDVYSLGVLLYELLTGRPPYDPKSLIRAGVEEIRRIIREVDPPRPSTRVSTLDDGDRATIAKLRRAAPIMLTSALRGDLDWIVMRCLEKDRERRYGTAAELADDVRRHLKQEPVNARPPSALYRAQKFVARNRLACASAGFILLTLIGATIISVREAVRANRAERLAHAQQDQAEALLTFMLDEFRTDLKKLGQLKKLNAVGERALTYFAALDPHGLSDTALTRQAKALTQIGEIRIEEASYDAATANFNAALARSTELTTRHPRNADMLFERAQAEYWIGIVARRRNDLARAREWLVRYRDSSAALVALEGKTPRAQRELVAGEHNLAVIELDRGNLAEARRSFLAEIPLVNELIARSPEDNTLRYRLADIASWLGRVAEADGRYADALEHCREMTTRLDDLIAREPIVARWKFRWSDSKVFTAYGAMILGRRTEALGLFAEAEKALTALTEQDPRNQQWNAALHRVRIQQATLLHAEGRPAEALAILDNVQPKIETLAATESAEKMFTSRLVASWALRARLRQREDPAGALAAAERALTLGEQLIKDDRADTWTLWEFAQACLIAGRLEQARNQSGAARLHWDRLRTVLTPRLAAWPSEWRFLDPMAQAFVLSDEPELARPLIERLKQFGYRPIDPSAAPTLGTAP